MSKTPIRTWSNLKKSGKLFSFNLKDNFGEIRISAFNQECDAFFDMIQIGKFFYISKAHVKFLNKQFTSESAHDYELALNSESCVTPDNDHDESCLQIDFNFIKIRDIESLNANDTIDLVALCRQVGGLIRIKSKGQHKELRKRDVSLVDDSEVEVNALERSCKLVQWKRRLSNRAAESSSK